MSDWWFQVTMESSHQSHLTRESRSNTIGSAPVLYKKTKNYGIDLQLSEKPIISCFLLFG